jgi:1-acyl-sn-glycerol-3-phosphate acyltransferase
MMTEARDRAGYSVFYGFCHLMTSLVSRTFFWRRIVGLENWVPGPALITPNHASFLDPPLIGSALREQIGYLARKDLFGNVFLRAICWRLNMIPVERNTADHGSIKRVLAALGQGRKVLLFPEGVRTSDGTLGAAMPGVGFIVHRARVPVIPVYTHGTYRAWPRHRLLAIPSRTAVVFGKPVRFDQRTEPHPTRETYQAIANEIMARIAALKPLALANA